MGGPQWEWVSLQGKGLEGKVKKNILEPHSNLLFHTNVHAYSAVQDGALSAHFVGDPT